MVEANRWRLVVLLTGLFVMLGSGQVVSRALKRKVLARLVPMESALRRLIFTMARDLDVILRSARMGPVSVPKGRNGGRCKPVFRLTDRPRLPEPPLRSCPRRNEPRITSLDEGGLEPVMPEPAGNDLLDAKPLRSRLEAMKAALENLPGQAQRLARWYARQARMRKKGKWARLYPIRMGRAPGWRSGGRRDVDVVLFDCHDLATRCLHMIEDEKYA